jgi:ribonuclease H / adenosylcobalamin/alpha-ribazole phosphatase
VSSGIDRTPGWMAPAGPPTTTVLLRHGDTPLSPEKRFSGVGDARLSRTGAVQAHAAARRLRARGGIGAVVSSPLRRALQTAEVAAAALDLPVLVDEDLRETDFGAWEGLTFAEALARWPDLVAAWLADPSVAPPGGESFADTALRVQHARDRLLARLPRGTILVVSHVTPIKTLVRLALQAPPIALHRMHLDSACLTELDWYQDGPAVLRAFNDTHHLPPD